MFQQHLTRKETEQNTAIETIRREQQQVIQLHNYVLLGLPFSTSVYPTVPQLCNDVYITLYTYFI